MYAQPIAAPVTVKLGHCFGGKASIHKAPYTLGGQIDTLIEQLWSDNITLVRFYELWVPSGAMNHILYRVGISTINAFK